MNALPTLRIVIADDEAPARERLRGLLARAGSAEVIAEAANGRAAIEAIERSQPDVAILDIQMPDIDGLRVLESLDDPPAVIFSTAYEHHALRAFDLDAVDYLLKPYSADRLRRALDRARRHLAMNAPSTASAEASGNATRIEAELGRQRVPVPLSEIVRLRIEGGVVLLNRIDGETLTCAGNLNDVEPHLPESRFLRISRQAIVNMEAVTAFEPHGDGGLRLALAGGIEEIVSRRRAPFVRDHWSRR